MANLSGLPAELLLEVLKITATRETIARPLSTVRVAQLSRTCKRFQALLRPVLWKHIEINDSLTLELLHEIVTVPDSDLGLLIQSIVLTYDVNTFPDQGWFGDGTEEFSSISDLLQDILDITVHLRRLRLDNRVSGSRFDFDIKLPPMIQSISLSEFSCNPKVVDELLSIGTLAELALWDCTSEADWTLIGNFILKKLTLGGRHLIISDRDTVAVTESMGGMPNSVILGFLRVCPAVEELSIAVTKDTFSNPTVLELLAKLPLSSFWLSCHEDPVSKLSDFSAWRNLTELGLTSCIMWPIRDSWHIREAFYRNLPRSLKLLYIRFPGSVSTQTQNSYDGVVQDNVNPTHPLVLQYRDKVIPQSRYKWLLNLLSCCEDALGNLKPCLPELDDIWLHETMDVGEHYVPVAFMRQTRTGPLPPDIDRQFRERKISLRVTAITYENLVDDEGDYLE